MADDRKQGRKFEEVKPEMTPMIDVTFLLLIFFIVTLKFKTLEGMLEAALPKDMGTAQQETEEIEKVDIVLRVANPGRRVPDPENPKVEMYDGRVVKYEVGTQVFNSADTPALRKFLDNFDKKETPVTLDSRKDTVYGDVVKVLDVVIALEFEKITFAGSHELD